MCSIFIFPVSRNNIIKRCDEKENLWITLRLHHIIKCIIPFFLHVENVTQLRIVRGKYESCIDIRRVYKWFFFIHRYELYPSRRIMCFWQQRYYYKWLCIYDAGKYFQKNKPNTYISTTNREWFAFGNKIFYHFNLLVLLRFPLNY